MHHKVYDPWCISELKAEIMTETLATWSAHMNDLDASLYIGWEAQTVVIWTYSCWMMRSDPTLCFGMTLIYSLFPQPSAFSHTFKWRTRYLLFKKRQKYLLFHSSHHRNPSITNADTTIPLYNVKNTTTICSHLTEDGLHKWQFVNRERKKWEKRERDRK